MDKAKSVCNECVWFNNGFCFLNPPAPVYTKESPERVMESTFKRPSILPDAWCSYFSNSRSDTLCNHKWLGYEKIDSSTSWMINIKLVLQCELCGDVKVIKV